MVKNIAAVERSASQPYVSTTPARYWVLLVITLVYALNIADRFVLSTLIEPIKAEFHLSDASVGFLTGVALAIFYTAAGIPLGLLADRANRRNMIVWALAIWSLFTALCGMAQTFWQLLLARIGVGVGEAGGTPPSHSLIADYFPPAERILAMSIFALGVALGSAIGGIGGGVLAEEFGWRRALILFAFFNLPIIALLLTVREPRRGQSDLSPYNVEQVGLFNAVRFIRSQRSLVHLFVGGTLATFSGMGLVWWTPAFLMRSHDFSVGEAGVQVGLMSGLGGGLAMGAAMLITIRLARLEAKWQCHFLAWTTLLITIPAVLGHIVQDTHTALMLLWLFIPFTNLYVGPSLALLQNLTKAEVRGVTVSLALFTTNIANLVVAPQFIGFASDQIAGNFGDPRQSLRIALAFSGLVGIWAAIHFWLAIRTLSHDLLRAGSVWSVEKERT